MPSIHPLHSPFSSHSLSISSSTPSCLHHQRSCSTDANNLTMDLSSTTDDSSSSDILEAVAAAWITAASAQNMWNEEEENEDADIAIWDRPQWATWLVRLPRWCCRPTAAVVVNKPFHGNAISPPDRCLSSKRQVKQQSQRAAAQTFYYYPTQQAQTHGTTQLFSPTEMEYVIPPHSPAAYAYSSVYSQYQQQLLYQQQQHQQQLQQQRYPQMSSLNSPPRACYQQQAYPLSVCNASVETCSDISMDNTSQMTNILSTPSATPTPVPIPPPPPISSPTKPQQKKSILARRATTGDITSCSNNKVYYPPPPLSPKKEKSHKKRTVRSPSTLSRSRRRSLPATPPAPAPSCTNNSIGKPPLARVSSSSSLGLPPLNHHNHNNHTQTTTMTNTISTSCNSGPTTTSPSPSLPPPVPGGCVAGGGGGGPSRPRILSEFSRVSSMVSSSSRHRRQLHNSFEFSMSSLNQINSSNAAPNLLRPEVPPCLFIEVNNGNFNCNSHNSQQDFDDDSSQQRPRHYSWSSWDDEEKYQGGADNDSLANDEDVDDDEWDDGPPSVPSGPSQPLVLQQQQSSLETPPPLVTRIVQPPIAQLQISALSGSSFSSPMLSTTRKLYLPICPLLDAMVRDGRVVVSGWAAVSLDERIHQELTTESSSETGSCSLTSLKRSDLAYVQLIQLDRSTYKLCIHRRGLEDVEEQDNGNDDDDNVSSASMVDSLLLTSSLQVSSEEVGGRAGHCIQLRSHDNTVLCTLLPVSLPDYFFCAGSNHSKIVSQEEFSKVQQCMFTPFNITGASSSPPPSSSSSSQKFINRTSSLSLSESSSSGSSTCSTRTTSSSSAAAAAPPQSGEAKNSCVASWGGREYYRRRFAPDQQHDATRHLLFALDTAVRQSGPTSLY